MEKTTTKKVILHKYDLVYAQEITERIDKNTTKTTGMALYFKQRNVSPASSLFVRVYVVRVPNMAIDEDVLRNNKKIVVDGYVKDGHLHVLQDIRELIPVSLDNYEEVGAFPMYRKKGEEELEDFINGQEYVNELA